MNRSTQLGLTLLVLSAGGLLTTGATVAGALGWGADDALRQQVSLRTGSPGGRVLVGGGLRGGK